MASELEHGILVGLLIGEGHFGGDRRQPQITLRLHVRTSRCSAGWSAPTPAGSCMVRIPAGSSFSGWCEARTCATRFCRSSRDRSQRLTGTPPQGLEEMRTRSAFRLGVRETRNTATAITPVADTIGYGTAGGRDVSRPAVTKLPGN